MSLSDQHRAMLEQAQTFIRKLAGHEPVTFQTYSDRDDLKVKRPDGKTFDPNAKIMHGTLATPDDFQKLQRLNSKGAGVFMLINKGDGKGRGAQNVVSIRALFIDTDGAPYPDPLPLTPHLVVQSSPGRWHLYFLVEGVPLAYFATLQKALAKFYGTDPSINDLPRVMRLPGFDHQKAEPITVQLLEVNDHPRYTYADVLRAWPYLPEVLEAEAREKAESKAKRQRMLAVAQERRKRDYKPDERERERLDKLLQAHHDAVAAAPDGQRHETLKNHARALGGYVASNTITYEEAQEVLAAAAEVCDLPESEAAGVIEWGLEKGQSDPLTLKALQPLAPLTRSPERPRSRRARQIARLRKERRARA